MAVNAFSLILGIVCIYVARWLWQNIPFYRNMIILTRQFPGPPALPFPIGNALSLDTEHEGFFRQLRLFQAEHGRKLVSGTYRIWLGPRPMIIVTKGFIAEQVFSSTKYIEKAFDYEFLQPWLGTGLLTSTGDKWRSRRKFLTPAFHFQILADFVDVFYEQSCVLVQKFGPKAATGETFDVCPYVTRCTLDIICETAMGKKIHAQNADSSYVKAVYRISDLTFDRMVKPHWWSDRLYFTLGQGQEYKKTLKVLHDFTDGVVAERKATVQQPSENRPAGPKRMAFLDSLLQAKTEDGELLDNASIREEVDTFMFEGHDTTAAATFFAIFLLGSHPDVQKRAQEEIDTVFGSSDRKPTVDDLKNMPYLENIVKETLRLYPSVPFMGRKVPENITTPASCEFDSRVRLASGAEYFVFAEYFELDLHKKRDLAGGEVIPKGSTVLLFVFGIHRNPDVYPNPEAFDPDRFAEGGTVFQTAFDYVPFSAGPRNCIGQRFALMEEKVILSTVLRNFTIRSTLKPDELQVLGELILRPTNGVKISLEKRFGQATKDP